MLVEIIIDYSSHTSHSCVLAEPIAGVYTVQEYLLARVIFGEFVCKKQLADFILAEFLQF